MVIIVQVPQREVSPLIVSQPVTVCSPLQPDKPERRKENRNGGERESKGCFQEKK